MTPGGVGGDEHLGEAVAGAAGDEEVAGLPGRLDRTLRRRRARRRRRRPGSSSATVAEAVVGRRLAVGPGGDAGRRRAAPASTSAWRRRRASLSAPATTLVGSERPGRGVAAELVGDERQVDEPVAADASRRRGPRRRAARSSRARRRAASSRRRTRAGRPRRPRSVADGHQVLEEPCGGLPEELLVGAQVELHGWINLRGWGGGAPGAHHLC